VQQRAREKAKERGHGSPSSKESSSPPVGTHTNQQTKALDMTLDMDIERPPQALPAG
jgi:hypothetical protein